MPDEDAVQPLDLAMRTRVHRWRRDIERETAKPAFMQFDISVDPYRLQTLLDHLDALEAVVFGREGRS